MLMRNRFFYTTRYMKMAPDDGGGGGASPDTSSPSGGDSGETSVPASSPADGGGSPAPSAPDSSASTSPTPEPANPWDSLGDLGDLDAIEIPAQPAPAAEAVPPVAPAVPPVATPPVAPAAQPQAVQPPAPQPTTQPEAAAPPALSPSDPVGIATAMAASRNDVIAHLAQDRFALSQEDIQELETDAAAFVPKMMARVMFEAQTSMMKFLAQAVPGMIGNHTKVTKANSEAETKFFDSHKALGLDSANPEHRAVAGRLATVYRQANPNMPLEQLIAEVGPMVAASLRANGKLTAVASAAVPAAAPRGGTPFRPAVNGGGGASPAPAAQSEWAGLGQTFDD